MPLKGKRIVVTRAPEQSRELIVQLEELGAEVVSIPLVSFHSVEDPTEFDEAIRSIGKYDWLLFTSQNAVRFFCERCWELGFSCSELQSPRPMIAVAGPTTAAMARDRGFRADHVARHSQGSALAKELWGAVTGRRVLLPRSDRAARDLPDALREGGAEVTEILAYRTLMPEAAAQGTIREVSDGDVDVVSFASPSAFDNFSDALGRVRLKEVAKRTKFAAIGPTTAAAIRAAGFEVAIEADEASSRGLVKALEEYYSRSQENPS